MIYLNTVEKGGYTSFPKSYISCKPVQGTAVIWNNLNNDCSFFTKIEQTFDYDFDGYIIATPVVSHYNIAKALLEKSKNILIEKPITMDAISASKLLILAKERNVFAMGGHLLLYHPAFIKMKELIHEGKIGKIKYIYSNRLNFGKIRQIEDVLWSLAPHDISILQYLTNLHHYHELCMK